MSNEGNNRNDADRRAANQRLKELIETNAKRKAELVKQNRVHEQKAKSVAEITIRSIEQAITDEKVATQTKLQELNAKRKSSISTEDELELNRKSTEILLPEIIRPTGVPFDMESNPKVVDLHNHLMLSQEVAEHELGLEQSATLENFYPIVSNVLSALCAAIFMLSFWLLSNSVSISGYGHASVENWGGFAFGIMMGGFVGFGISPLVRGRWIHVGELTLQDEIQMPPHDDLDEGSATVPPSSDGPVTTPGTSFWAVQKEVNGK